MPRAASRATPTILNEVGREQARALRERLAHLRPARIYASSSRRTRETAELAFGHLDLDLIVSDQLREIGLGDWEGQLYQDLEHRHPEAVRLFRQEPHNFRYPGAETFAELQARGLAALADIVAREEPGSDILVVSHGAMIRALLSHYLERPLSRLWEPPRMHNCAHSIIEFPATAARGCCAMPISTPVSEMHCAVFSRTAGSAVIG